MTHFYKHYFWIAYEISMSHIWHLTMSNHAMSPVTIEFKTTIRYEFWNAMFSDGSITQKC